MHPYPLDSVDRTLLNALQRDGRATVGDLAEAVSLSTSPCWRRVRALEEAGVIAGYHAHLHRQRVGWGVLGFVQLALHDHTAETTSALESLSSGQKILVRMGPANEARAKALIRELRKRVATSALQLPQR